MCLSITTTTKVAFPSASHIYVCKIYRYIYIVYSFQKDFLLT